ncbi:MAG: hypothetical protein E7668_00630 [Ruminococcaceae bacterium]|nr:hypothetical protein [Oscillospiraceae bacterium]
MNVKQFAEQFGYQIVCMPDETREITGGYAGDLLSWVMGRLTADYAWVTIMSNINIVAVAALADPACIILSEWVEPDSDVVSRAVQQGINILRTDRDTFSVCLDLSAAV